VLLRDLPASGRRPGCRIELQDPAPARFFGVVKLFDRYRVNIVEVSHQRILNSLPAKGAEIDVRVRSARRGPDCSA